MILITSSDSTYDDVGDDSDGSDRSLAEPRTPLGAHKRAGAHIRASVPRKPAGAHRRAAGHTQALVLRRLGDAFDMYEPCIRM